MITRPYLQSQCDQCLLSLCFSVSAEVSLQIIGTSCDGVRLALMRTSSVHCALPLGVHLRERESFWREGVVHASPLTITERLTVVPREVSPRKPVFSLTQHVLKGS